MFSPKEILWLAVGLLVAAVACGLGDLDIAKVYVFVNLQNLIQFSTIALFATVGSISFCHMKPAPAR